MLFYCKMQNIFVPFFYRAISHGEIGDDKMSNQIVEVIQKTEVESSTALSLQNAFEPLFLKAKEWEAKAKEIIVTDPTQLTEMKQARELRLELRSVRIEANKVRERLKADSLRYGKAVQSVYNLIEFFIVPLEEHLEKQEKYAETIEKERQQKLREERTLILSEYAQFLPPYGDLGIIVEAEFQRILDIGKREKQAFEDAEAKRIQEQKDREEKDRLQREEERKERERLQKELEEQQAKAKAEREEMQKKLNEERFAREKVEREQQAKAKAEREDAERIAKEKQKEANAPDVEKLMLLALQIDGLTLPEVSSDASKAVIEGVKTLLAKTSDYIRKNAEVI
jgi:hypothetical protein